MPHAEQQEMLTIPQHLISPLFFIQVHVVLSIVSPYFIKCLNINLSCHFLIV